MKFFEIIPPDTNIQFISKAKILVLGSAVVVLVAIIITAINGLNWGIDFAGGLEMRVDFHGAAQNITIGDVRDAMGSLPEDLPLKGVQVAQFRFEDENKNAFSIKAKGEENVARLEAIADAKRAAAPEDAVAANQQSALLDLSTRLHQHLETTFGKGTVTVVSTDLVGPRVGATLRKKGFYAIFYALIGILAYVGWRFNFRFSPGGVIALAHDVIITVGVFSFLQREISLVTIAALLTIAGYSINDTIVVYDRIREGRERKYRTKPLDEAVNLSINETLSRTLLTSGTTLIVVAALLFLGGEILFDFALALMIGVLVGTYSSVFIASPIYVWLENGFAARRKARGALR
ncbi:MAG: protein translocase subunit SecF [Candidatus Lernaella stagnicola]|nr:protein translocase subunit SecF [Candidatus Lernaella stagnicola]